MKCGTFALLYVAKNLKDTKEISLFVQHIFSETFVYCYIAMMQN